MLDRSGAMSFVLKNGNDVTSFDRTQPKGGKIFHRGLVKFLVVLDASIEGTKSRKQEERKEERRRFLEDVSWHQRFAVPRYIENIKPRFPFFLLLLLLLFPLTLRDESRLRLPFAAYNKLCMAEHFNSLVSSCV